jgi:hypothetical protein
MSPQAGDLGNSLFGEQNLLLQLTGYLPKRIR